MYSSFVIGDVMERRLENKRLWAQVSVEIRKAKQKVSEEWRRKVPGWDDWSITDRRQLLILMLFSLSDHDPKGVGRSTQTC